MFELSLVHLNVDFVVEVEDFVLFVESKNFNFKESKHAFDSPDKEKINRQRISSVIVFLEIFRLFHDFIKNFFVPFRRVAVFVEQYS